MCWSTGLEARSSRECFLGLINPQRAFCSFEVMEFPAEWEASSFLRVLPFVLDTITFFYFTYGCQFQQIQVFKFEVGILFVIQFVQCRAGNVVRWSFAKENLIKAVPWETAWYSTCYRTHARRTSHCQLFPFLVIMPEVSQKTRMLQFRRTKAATTQYPWE